MDTDLISRWILLGKEVSLSIHNGRIELGHDKEQANIVAYLMYQNGFYIRPEKAIEESTTEESAIDKNIPLMINQQVIFDKMPINENAIISLNDFEFSLQSLSN